MHHFGPRWGKFFGCGFEPPFGGRVTRHPLNQRASHCTQNLGPMWCIGAVKKRVDSYMQNLGPRWGKFRVCGLEPPLGGRVTRHPLNQRASHYTQHLGPIWGISWFLLEALPGGRDIRSPLKHRFDRPQYATLGLDAYKHIANPQQHGLQLENKLVRVISYTKTTYGTNPPTPLRPSMYCRLFRKTNRKPNNVPDVPRGPPTIMHAFDTKHGLGAELALHPGPRNGHVSNLV
jgi:hypothetical protein